MRNCLIIALLIGSIALTGCCHYRIVQVTASHIPVDQRADAIQDSTLTRFIEPYKVLAGKTANEVIGYAEQDMNPGYPGYPESLLGNFFCDVMLAYSRQLSANRVDFAVTNPDGLRKPILKGNITTGNIYELMPFENTLAVLDLKGTDVQALADSIASHQGGPVAGIRFGIKNNKAVNVMIEDKPLDTNATYRVAANDYIAAGNDHFAALTKAVKAETFPESLRNIIIDWIKQESAKGNKINAALNERIYEEQ